MAMISEEPEVSAFRNAKKGEDVRDALCSLALKIVNAYNDDDYRIEEYVKHVDGKATVAQRYAELAEESKTQAAEYEELARKYAVNAANKAVDAETSANEAAKSAEYAAGVEDKAITYMNAAAASAAKANSYKLLSEKYAQDSANSASLVSELLTDVKFEVDLATGELIEILSIPGVTFILDTNDGKLYWEV